jgi:uncharacterized protein (TIGR02246 family)
MSHPALALLDSQRDAWNRGDLDGYLAACAPDVVYLTARGPVFGREALGATLAAAYPDRAAMGTLALEILRVDGDATEARVVLRWSVTRAASPVGGFALVVLRAVKGRWEMTHDATLG